MSSYPSADIPTYNPDSQSSTPPETPSPQSPAQSTDNLPIPQVRVAQPGMSSQYTPVTTPDSATSGNGTEHRWKHTPSYLPLNEKSSNGLSVSGSGGGGSSSTNLSLGESIPRERTSPTRPTGFREQQDSPNHFTPAFHTPSSISEKSDDGLYQSGNVNAGAGTGGGAHTRRQYANVTPTSYTTPAPYPLTRTPSNPGRADGVVKAGFYDSPAYWLVLYFFFNLGLTLFNKIVLVSFPFPYVSKGYPTVSRARA